MKVDRRIFLISSLASASTGAVQHTAFAAPAAKDTKKLDRLIDDYCTQRHIPAFGLAAAINGAPIYTRHYGHASMAFNAPVTSSTLFHLGSVSKHITAAAILMLADAGKLKLDDPLSLYLPDLEEGWGRRTLRQLMTHTAGVPDYFDFGIEFDRPLTRIDLKRFTKEFPPFAPPGQVWQYCNAGYTLLGYVIENITGKSYADFITQTLFRNNGLRDSRTDDGEAVIVGRAEPVEWTDGSYRRAPQSSSTIASVAAGGLLMSTRDAPLWVRALDGSLLSTKAKHAMFTAAHFDTGRSSGYALGWGADTIGGQLVYYHTGSVPGYRCFHLRSPNTGFSLMALGVGAADLKPLGWLIAHELDPGSSPHSLSAIFDDAPHLTQLARGILSGELEPDQNQLAPEIIRLPPAMRNLRISDDPVVAKSARDLQLVEDVNNIKTRLRRYRCAVGSDVVHIQVGHTPDEKVFLVQET